MSFIVKGIDIEKYSQAIIIHPSGKVYKYDGDWRIDNNSPYQAIQIPKGHGRLIDAKLLADTINKAIHDGTFTSKSIWEWIGDAPTILEAEKE